MTFTFINTRILPGGSTVVKTEDESIYLGSNINVALFMFITKGYYTFEGFSIDEMYKIKKVVLNLKKQKKYLNTYYNKIYEFKNVESMLIQHNVEFYINSDLNNFIKETNDFFEIKKIDVSYKNNSLKLIGTKKVYGYVCNNYFRDYIYDEQYPINETLLLKQDGMVKVLDLNKYNQRLGKRKTKRK